MKLLHGGSFEVTSLDQVKFHGGWWGKTNHLGRIVDLGLLSQSTKSWGIWLARERERERSTKLEALESMEEREKLM
jgi:hypothetical protein